MRANTDGAPANLRRGPKIAVWTGLAVFVILGAAHVSFGFLGLAIMAVGAYMVKHRKLAAGRYYSINAQRMEQKDVAEGWQGDGQVAGRQGAPQQSSTPMTVRCGALRDPTHGTAT